MSRSAKTLLTAFLLAATITPVDAAPRTGRPHAPRKAAVGTNVAYERSANKLVLPIVGRAAGQNGTFFKSAVTFSNFKGFLEDGLETQRIKLEFYPAGTSGVGAPAEFFELDNLGIHFDDFLNDFYEPAKSGLGAVVVTAVDANGNPDPEGRIDATMRVYTAQASSTGCPNPGGNVSQAASALPYEDLQGTVATAYIKGLRHDAQYRTNIGIVNHDTVPHTFTVHLFPFNGNPDIQFNIVVQGKSLTHVGIPAGDYGPSLIAEMWTDDPGDFYWSAYGSSTDNATGDGWINYATWN